MAQATAQPFVAGEKRCVAAMCGVEAGLHGLARGKLRLQVGDKCLVLFAREMQGAHQRMRRVGCATKAFDADEAAIVKKGAQSDAGAQVAPIFHLRVKSGAAPTKIEMAFVRQGGIREKGGPIGDVIANGEYEVEVDAVACDMNRVGRGFVRGGARQSDEGSEQCGKAIKKWRQEDGEKELFPCFHFFACSLL